MNELLTLDELAKALSMDRMTLDDHRRRGRIPHVVVGKRAIRFNRVAVIAALDAPNIRISRVGAATAARIRDDIIRSMRARPMNAADLNRITGGHGLKREILNSLIFEGLVERRTQYGRTRGRPHITFHLTGFCTDHHEGGA